MARHISIMTNLFFLQLFCLSLNVFFSIYENLIFSTLSHESHIFRIVCSFASSIICNRVPGLTTAQRQLCSEAPDAFIALGDGHMLGAEECQHQFKGKRKYMSHTFILFHFHLFLYIRFEDFGIFPISNMPNSLTYQAKKAKKERKKEIISNNMI